MTHTREDYEAAARAAGLRIEWVDDLGPIIVNADGTRGAWWAPIHDDGESRRLQMAAMIDLRFSSDRTSVCAIHDFPFGPSASAPVGTDPCAAAREAVWRVAVAVGKEMKE